MKPMIRRKRLFALTAFLVVLSLAFLQVPAVEASPDVRVYQNPEPQNECSIAVNPTNPDNIVIGFNDYTPGHWIASYSYSTDRGITWTYGGSLPRGTLSGRPFCDPWLAFDSSGYLYYVAMSASAGHEIFVCVGRPDAYGDVGPLGFGAPQVVDDGLSGKNDKPAIAVDATGGTYDGNIYVVWAHRAGAGNYKIWFRRGTRTGPTTITWTEAGFQVSPTTVLYTQGPQVAVGPNGEVYVAHAKMTSSSIPTEDEILLSRSLDGGASWTTGIVVSSVDAVPWYVPNTNEGARHSSFPTLGVSPATGTIFVAWADDGNGDADILLSKSTDQGDTWSYPIVVNTDQYPPEPNGKDQFHPALTVTPGGNLDIIYYDRRDCPNNKFINLYLSRSTNEGSTFTDVRISSATANPDAFSYWASSMVGDYVGIDSAPTALGETTFISWGDGRHGNTLPRDYNSEVYFDTIITISWRVIIDIIRDRIWDKILRRRPLELNMTILPFHGFWDLVSLNFTGVPGAQGVFKPSSGIPPFETTLYLNTTGVEAGTYELKIIAYNSEGKEIGTFSVTLVITTQPFILLEATAANPDDIILLEGDGFTEDSNYDVFFDGELLTTGKTTGVGSFSVEIEIPSDAPDGTHTVLVKDEKDIEASTTLVTPMREVETPEGAPPDNTPPSIDTPSREPAVDVTPDQEVTVSVNVTDAESGVKNVTLSYTTDGGENWNNITMKNPIEDTYQETIPGQSYCTEVKYKIIAYDNAENPAVEDNAGAYYVYHVIPEFPSAMILTLFMVFTLLAVILAKRKK